jgi:DNA replication protein DnaC
MNQEGSAPTPLEVEGGLTRIHALQDRLAWMTDAPAVLVPPACEIRRKPVCLICNDARWIKEAVPFGHPHFGVLFPCACLQAEWARRTARELAGLSNLDGVRDKTFATFNPFVPGLREVVPQVRAYAQRPDGWLTLLGAYGVGKTHLAAAIAHEALDRNGAGAVRGGY